MVGDVIAMIQAIKNIIKRTFLYDIIKYMREKEEMRDWVKKGKPVPPPHRMKQITVKNYGKKYSIHILIETGTYLGEMVYAAKHAFRRIFSIELDKALYERAREKFSKFEHISIVKGESSEVLPDILINLKEPCVFWLDGHYSEGITAKGKIETPIMQELHHILDHSISEHIILIDDARLFIGQNDWPTIEDLQNLIFEKHPDWEFEVKDDIIRIHKRHDI